MAGTQALAEPIVPYKALQVNAANFGMMRVAEEAGDEQYIGTPCVVDGGYAQESPAISGATELIAGFTSEAAHDLASNGVPETLHYGAVQNQPDAVNIPIGAPLSDGKLGFYTANDQVWFKGKTDDAATLAQDMVGDIAGLTKGSNGFWFVDTTITTTAGGACVEIVELIDAIGTVGGHVAFRVLEARQQFGGM